jgi:gas vesicle protein
MSSGKVVLGLLAGIATGAIVGILLAPDKGSDTRKKISKKSADYTGMVKDKINTFKKSMTDKFEKAKADVMDAAEQVESN